MPTNKNTYNEKQQNTGLYRTLWRWHFYAGLLCIPFIITLAISGSIYLFKPQIDAWQNNGYNNLTPSNIRSTPEQQVEAAKAALANATFLSYQLTENDRQAVVITLRHQGQKKQIFVNPYSLELLKIQTTDNQFIRLVRSFHGELLAGNAGSIIIELVGCWTIVLIVTGLYLWWPRNTKGLAGIIYPRIKESSRIFWRDLHAVIGFWVALFTLFLLISGLPWTLVWGNAFKEIRNYNEKPTQQDWQINEHANHKMNAPGFSLPITQTLVTNADALRFAAPALLSIDAGNPHQWILSSQHQNRPLRANAWFDGHTGKLIKVETFADRKALDRVIGYGIAAHEGQLFGGWNQALGLFTCLGLIVVAISGCMMWVKRKPEKVLGAPPSIKNPKNVKVAITILVVMALCLPLLAASLVVISLLEKLIVRHLPPIRQWLGIV